VSEEVVSAYEAEKENWLRNLSVARAARVRTLLRGERVDVDSSEAILGYRLRQNHVGVVAWIAGGAAGSDALGRLEHAIAEVAAEEQPSASRCTRTRSSTGYARPRRASAAPSARTA